MKMAAALLFSTLCVGGLLLAQDKTKTLSLEGTWKAVKADRDGKPFDKIVGDKLIFKGNTLTVKSDKEEKATFKLDASKTPAQIDIMPDSEKGKTVKGIVEVNGKIMRLCFGRPGTPRPTKFESSKKILLVTLEKE